MSNEVKTDLRTFLSEYGLILEKPTFDYAVGLLRRGASEIELPGWILDSYKDKRDTRLKALSEAGISI